MTLSLPAALVQVALLCAWGVSGDPAYLIVLGIFTLSGPRVEGATP